MFPYQIHKLPLPESLASQLREATSDAIADDNEENESSDESCEEGNMEDAEDPIDSDIDI